MVAAWRRQEKEPDPRVKGAALHPSRVPPGGGHVLVAPDKFKGSLTAPEVARHVAAGLRRARPSIPVLLLPVADGGDGTVEAAVSAGWKQVDVRVCGPAGRLVTASLAV